MGKWVILIGGDTFGPQAIRAMSFTGRNLLTDWPGKQLDVSFPEGLASFQFDYNGDIRHDYDPAVWTALPYKDPRCVLLRYSSPDVLARILNAPDFPENVLIDADGMEDRLPPSIDRKRLLNPEKF